MTPSSPYPLFPEITPFQSAYLPVSAVHQMYYEQCGNPNGYPVVFLHGGPGSGCNAGQRRFFDPAFYRIILLDQRGCGRSLPLGETQENTTQDLVRDIEALRKHLNINQWLVFGGSWGSTLALAYALTHPNQVSGLILRGIFLSSSAELDWFLGEVAQFYLEAWETLLNPLDKHEHESVLDAYAKRVFSSDPNVSIPAACRWNAFEASIMTLLPSATTQTFDAANPQLELARARVQIHYLLNLCFVAPYDFLNQAHQLAHIPTTIVQGRYDMVCPPATAYKLHTAMPHASFHMIPDAGHSGMEAGTREALIAACESFKQLVSI